jgi:hypothetical protein
LINQGLFILFSRFHYQSPSPLRHIFFIVANKSTLIYNDHEITSTTKECRNRIKGSAEREMNSFGCWVRTENDMWNIKYFLLLSSLSFTRFKFASMTCQFNDKILLFIIFISVQIQNETFHESFEKFKTDFELNLWSEFKIITRAEILKLATY